MQPVVMLLVSGVIMFSVIGGLSLLAHYYTLNGIKSKTVGDGQHGTARFATKKEIEETYVEVTYEPERWRKGENLPTAQGLVLGSIERAGKLYALVDTGDVHCLMIGAAGVGKTAHFLYPNIEYACACGMSFLTTDTKGDLYRNYAGIAKKYYGYQTAVIDLRNPTRSIVPMIQSFAQLNKNYGKEGAEIIIDNCQDTIFGGFAPNSESAEVLSKSLGNKTVMSGSISRGKNDPSQSLQMIQRPLMTPDELKSLPKGNFIVSKTGSHPMRTKLKLFLKWGITFEEPYEIEEKSARKVAYADKQEIEEEIIRRYMCCVDEEPESTEQGTASRSGGMLQSQMNETVAKVRQALRTED